MPNWRGRQTQFLHPRVRNRLSWSGQRNGPNVFVTAFSFLSHSPSRRQGQLFDISCCFPSWQQVPFYHLMIKLFLCNKYLSFFIMVLVKFSVFLLVVFVFFVGASASDSPSSFLFLSSFFFLLSFFFLGCMSSCSCVCVLVFLFPSSCFFSFPCVSFSSWPMLFLFGLPLFPVSLHVVVPVLIAPLSHLVFFLLPGPTCLLCLHCLDLLSSFFEFVFFWCFFCLCGVFCNGFWFVSFQFSSSSWDSLSLIVLSWCCFSTSCLGCSFVCVCVFLGLPFYGIPPGGSYGHGQPGGVNIFFGFFHNRGVWVKTAAVPQGDPFLQSCFLSKTRI